ncbi:GDSL esterase/lipase LTL1 [Canna indica]|uniref:GDSL esterase/lipase LTL1 n=1 Tax=Canna indica TaxID=4628 RepID=A0AAQ3Q6W7_9LILI|nr:GDSL esterase/lipase LTL1 [Canna indica]
MDEPFLLFYLANVLALFGSFSALVEARAFFVFGDSLVDCGNNNYLATSARADALPYGEYLGTEPSLPYLSPELQGEKLLLGANFASAGVGILNDTGVQFVNIIRISKQLQYFQEYQQKLSAMIGPSQAQKLVNQALVLITLGGNDFVNNYFLVHYSLRSREFTLPDYIRYLISEYKKVLSTLYELGARRIIVTGTGPLGCAPSELALRSPSGECDPDLQHAADLFNPQLEQILMELNSQIGSDVYISADAFKMHTNFISNPEAFGFKSSKIACCGQGPFNALGLCSAASNLCENREEYVFFDGFHPSEKACRILVAQLFNGSTEYMRPMNLSTILAMDAKL